MKALAHENRPREKRERAGVTTLGDGELLALLIGHGTAGANALDIANRLLAAADGVHGLTRMSSDDLACIPGVGAALSSRILAGVELGRRTLVQAATPRPQFVTPHDAARFLLPRYGAHPVERFGVLLVDARHRLIRTRLLTVGSADASVVHPREVFREATLARAAAIVLFHNHPSGDPAPSRDDLVLTQRLVGAGEIMGIEVIDHVILADTQYYSLKEAGHM